MKKKMLVNVITGLLLTTGISEACSTFANNNKSGDYVFAKTRDVTFYENTPEYIATHQQFVRFQAPQGLYKFVALYYGQDNKVPDIFSTGTNEKDLTLTYNYDSHQLGKTGAGLATYITSVAKEESDLGEYILSNAKNLKEANSIVKKAVELNNAGIPSDVPTATPMFFGISEYNPNGVDQSEAIEIVIANGDKVKEVYKKAIESGKSETDAKADARSAVKLDYKVITGNPMVQTNSVNAPELQKYVTDVPSPPESKSRYEALTTLMRNSSDIASKSNDNANQPYNTELAHMFAKNYFVPGQDYVDAEDMAVSRNHTKATYIVSRVQSKADDSDNGLSLFVELTSELQIYNRAVIQLDSKFWSSHKDGDIIVSNTEPYSFKPEVRATMLKGVF